MGCKQSSTVKTEEDHEQEDHADGARERDKEEQDDNHSEDGEFLLFHEWLKFISLADYRIFFILQFYY